MGLRPLFLLSLPRAGSTLAQRVLAAHPEISTASEPWLLLPYLYAMRPRGIRAEYWQESAAEALEDFATQLDGGHDRYRSGLRDFALGLYRSCGRPDAKYFLDKTPHYHAIADQLPRLFPDAKFVVLWRNPLAVLSSMLSTFREDRFEPYLFSFNLFDGPANLTRFATESGSPIRTHVVRYEDLVGSERELHWQALFDYLELDFERELLNEFAGVELRGRYGDPTASQFSAISTRSVDRWKQSLAGEVRKRWCRRWLRWLGHERLAVMGYELDELLDDLASLSSRGSNTKDLAHLARSRTWAGLRKAALSLPDSPRPLGELYG